MYFILYTIDYIPYTLYYNYRCGVFNKKLVHGRVKSHHFEIPNRSIFAGFPYEKPSFLRLLYKSAFGTPKSAKTIEKPMVF